MDVFTSGFLEEKADDKQLAGYLAGRAGSTITAVEPKTTGVFPPHYAAALVTQASQVNAGARMINCELINALVVRPMHKRQGLSRALLTRRLQELHAAGVPLAALSATDAQLYERYGFGVATHCCGVEVDTRGLAMAPQVPLAPGTVEPCSPADIAPYYQDITTAFAQAGQGRFLHRRQDKAWNLGISEGPEAAADKAVRVLAYIDEAGTPAGFASYKCVGSEGKKTIKLLQLCGIAPAIELRLWQELFNIELSNRLTWGGSYPGDLVPLALNNPRAWQQKSRTDSVWLRILDAPAALQARGYTTAGELVLDISDPLHLVDNSYLLTVRDGHADVSAAANHPAPRLKLSVGALSQLYFGAVTVMDLNAVGKVSGSPAALDTAQRLFAVATPAHNLAEF